MVQNQSVPIIDVSICIIRQKHIAHLLSLPISRDIICRNSKKWPLKWALPAIQCDWDLCGLRQIRQELGLNIFVKACQVGTNICSVRYVKVRPQHKHGFPELRMLNSSKGQVWGYQKDYQLLSPSCLAECRNELRVRGLYILSVHAFGIKNHSLTPNCDNSPWPVFEPPHFLCSAWRRRVDVLLPPVQSSGWANTFQHALQRALGEPFWISAPCSKCSQTVDLFAFVQEK